MTRYAMAINVERCIGCHTCAVACKINNNLPKDIWRNRVDTVGGAYMDTAGGTYPDNLKKDWYPVSCQHCAMPSCFAVCPTGATSVRDDGIVVVDTEICIGCGTCVEACPYEARTVTSDEIEYYTEHALGDWDAPEHRNKTAEKCDFCLHRLERGEKPACMEFCPSDARHWGDIEDPESDVSRYIANKKIERMLESEGTDPQCYYVVKT
jgi:molybdopterin-containing oxidoreductase family iron-sulfur binding subunit